MQNPFLRSAGPAFRDRNEILGLAREAAARMGAACPEVEQGVLFGSFARNDYGVHSDLDLLVILDRTEKSVFQRLDEYLPWAPAYPTDILPLTRFEVQSRLERSDPFLRRALNEGITLYSRPASGK